MKKKHLLGLVIWAIIYFILNIYNVTGLLIVMPAVLFITAIKKPILAISMWLITLPIGDYAYQNIFHLNRGLLLIALTLKLAFSKKVLINAKIVGFTVVIFFVSMINLGINNSFIIFSEYLYLYNSLGLFFLIIHFSFKAENNFGEYLFIGLILGAVTIVLTVLFQFDTSMLYGRLSFNESIRRLSNGLALPTLILYMNILTPNKLQIRKLNKAWAVAILIIFSIFLILTDSRGVVMPLAISGIFYTMSNLSTKSLKNIFKGVVPVVIGTMLAFAYFDFSSKFRLRLIDFDSNNRLEIWRGSIGSFLNESVPRLFFGGGLGSFENYAMTGYGGATYSHSVFIDSLVAFGIIGFVLLICLVGYLFLVALKARNNVALSILLFTVLTFSTHGNLQHNLFWFNLALIVILLKSPMRNNKYLGSNPVM